MTEISATSTVHSAEPTFAGPPAQQTLSLFCTFVLPAASLTQREVVRFLRQPSRVMGGLATPIMFWLLLGSGFGTSFHVKGVAAASGGYLQYLFTGALVLIVLFTAIFSTISLIQDRNEGFLQGIVVSPARRSSIAVGKVLGSTVLATGHAVVFLLLARFAGIKLSVAQFLQIAGIIFVLSLGLSGLGFLIAWRMDSVQGYHSVMNLFLMPMWILSGAVFPASGASGWIKWVMAINPLTYGVTWVSRTLEGAGGLAADKSAPSLMLSAGVSCGFAVLMLVGCSLMTASRTKGSR